MLWGEGMVYFSRLIDDPVGGLCLEVVGKRARRSIDRFHR